MATTIPSSDFASAAGRAAHDLGLAGLLGGNLFGRMALHPAVTAISDKGERGQVVNAAWRRYGTINLVSLLAVSGGWIGARAEEASGRRRMSGRERTLARVKDGLLAATAVTGLATALEGIRFSRMAPDGAVPLEDGSTPAAEASPKEARAKRVLNVLGAVNAASEVGLVAVNAALAQDAHRRPKLRRLKLGS
jgi:hypothetical protein